MEMQMKTKEEKRKIAKRNYLQRKKNGICVKCQAKARENMVHCEAFSRHDKLYQIGVGIYE